METLKAIAMRKSTRAYKAEQITDEELDTIIGAGCAAPVGMGAYDTIHLTVLQNQDLMDQISEAAAKAAGKSDLKPFYGAPTVVIVSSKKNNQVPNIEYANAACIIENMLLAATDLGLGSVFLWGFINALNASPDILEKLDIPEGFTPVSGAAFGYPVEPLSEVKELKKTISMNIVK
ncbi:MAG: nitroreductase family protein [Syntrophaceticus sp.]